MEYFVLAHPFDVSQQREIVFQVLEHVEDQDKIEVRAFFLRDVCQFELKTGVLLSFAHLKGLWGNLIARQSAPAVQLRLQQPQDLASPAAYFTNAVRHD